MANARSYSKPHVLYRMRDVEKNILYIGITNDARSRWETHASTKSWWTDVASIEVEHFPDRHAVLAAERHAIETEHPRYNIASRRPPDVNLAEFLEHVAQIQRTYLETGAARKKFVKDFFAIPPQRRKVKVAEVAARMGLSTKRLYQIKNLP